MIINTYGAAHSNVCLDRNLSVISHLVRGWYVLLRIIFTHERVNEGILQNLRVYLQTQYVLHTAQMWVLPI